MLQYETDIEKFNLDLNCPYCGHLVRAIPQTTPIYRSCDITDTEAYLIVRCPRKFCGISFVIYDRLNNRVSRIFPHPNCDVSDFHEAIPEKIRQDFAEANKCLYGGSNKGVVVMCRRVMQLIAIDKNAEGDKLFEQIGSLFSKGLITQSLKDTAHEIRYFGNFGAHPTDDELDNITREESRIILDLVWEFLMDLYIRPFKTSKLTNKHKNN